MKTRLNIENLNSRRIAAAAAMALAAAVTLPLTACNKTDNANEWSVDQADGNKGKLVQGREGCIAELMKANKTRQEAEKICDQSTPVQHHHSSGSSNALLWYMIGRDSGRVSSYEGNPSSGLTYRGGYRDSYTPMNVKSGSVHSIRASSFHGPSSRGGMSPGHGVGGHGS